MVVCGFDVCDVLFTFVCVCVCACVRACMCARARSTLERELLSLFLLRSLCIYNYFEKEKKISITGTGNPFNNLKLVPNPMH